MEDDFYLIKLRIPYKSEITLQLKGNMTLKEMTQKYAFKTGIPIFKFGKTFFFYYQGFKLDSDSDEQISSIFKRDDLIIVEEKDEKKSTIYNHNKSRRDDILLRNNSIHNRPRCYSQYSQSYQIPQSFQNEVKEKENVKDEVKNLLEDMAVLGSIEKQMIESEQKKEPEKFISIDKCLNSADEQFFMQNIYKESGQLQS